MGKGDKFESIRSFERGTIIWFAGFSGSWRHVLQVRLIFFSFLRPNNVVVNGWRRGLLPIDASVIERC